MVESKTKELERVCLASLLQYNEFIPDISFLCKSEHFSERIHGTLFTAICALYSEKGKADEILLTVYLKSVGITTINDYDIFSYIEVLKCFSVNKDQIENYFKELVKYHILRKTHLALGNCQKYIKENLIKPVGEILPELERKLTEAVNLETDGSVEFNDLFGQMEAVCKERAESKSDFVIKTGFDLFDKRYSLAYNSLNIFCAPAKTGKSTWLMQIAKNAVSIRENHCRALILDTELKFSDLVFRNLASITDTNEWFWRSGNYINNKQYISKSEQAFEDGKKFKDLITHVYVGNMAIGSIISIIKRWRAKYVKPGEAALVILDYLKLGDDGIDSDKQEWELIGKKTDLIQKTIASLDKTVGLTAIQTNRQGDLSMSQRVSWFGDNIFKLTWKSPDELSADGEQFGSHKLVELFIRRRGIDCESGMVKVQTGDGKYQWRANHINYQFKNFLFTEKGDYSDVLSSSAKQLEPELTVDPYDNIKF